MEQLIQALQIFLKYGNPTCPTHCEHDVLYVMIDPVTVSSDDIAALATLGFSPDDTGLQTFKSHRFGSA